MASPPPLVPHVPAPAQASPSPLSQSVLNSLQRLLQRTTQQKSRSTKARGQGGGRDFRGQLFAQLKKDPERIQQYVSHLLIQILLPTLRRFVTTVHNDLLHFPAQCFILQADFQQRFVNCPATYASDLEKFLKDPAQQKHIEKAVQDAFRANQARFPTDPSEVAELVEVLTAVLRPSQQHVQLSQLASTILTIATRSISQQTTGPPTRQKMDKVVQAQALLVQTFLHYLCVALDKKQQARQN